MKGPFPECPHATEIQFIPRCSSEGFSCQVRWRDQRGRWHLVPRTWERVLTPLFSELWEEIAKQASTL